MRADPAAGATGGKVSRRAAGEPQHSSRRATQPACKRQRWLTSARCGWPPEAPLPSRCDFISARCSSLMPCCAAASPGWPWISSCKGVCAGQSSERQLLECSSSRPTRTRPPPTPKVCWCAAARSAWLTALKSSSSSRANTRSGVPASRAARCTLQGDGSARGAGGVVQRLVFSPHHRAAPRHSASALGVGMGRVARRMGRFPRRGPAPRLVKVVALWDALVGSCCQAQAAALRHARAGRNSGGGPRPKCAAACQDGLHLVGRGVKCLGHAAELLSCRALMLAAR